MDEILDNLGLLSTVISGIWAHSEKCAGFLPSTVSRHNVGVLEAMYWKAVHSSVRVSSGALRS